MKAVESTPPSIHFVFIACLKRKTRPKIKTPKGKDYKDAAKKVWDKLEIKKAFEEMKESHFI